ncbi:uncharacterized protein LOC130629240 [Hydractinia symbiolongicarpus]|uniref:uncharacterized protein LOC130629240 n=1 Tax=Hydractinia symbiolongicarpus TaxID=13093 RepID=UPI00254EDBFB|nr:uncharacterized protein LOC130629240 [Hydractinia symbiolongicarpus]
MADKASGSSTGKGNDNANKHKQLSLQEVLDAVLDSSHETSDDDCLGESSLDESSDNEDDVTIQFIPHDPCFRDSWLLLDPELCRMNEKDNDDVDDDDTDGNDQVQDNVSDLVDNENGNYVMSDNESTVCSGESDSEESFADQNINVASRARGRGGRSGPGRHGRGRQRGRGRGRQ